MAAREPINVLRLKRTDVKDEFILVLVNSKGRGDLDLELVASEGENAWSATFKESGVKRFKASNNQTSDETWAEVLKHGFLLTTPSSEYASEVSGLEVVATITKENRVSIVLRRNVGDLTQRLGTIDLDSTDGEAFDLWVGCAAAATLNAEARQRAQSLNAQLAEQIENNRKLQAQLRELIEAKEESENALLQKFTELLNAKKLKIRDQQRLLATAKVDEDKASKSVEEEAETSSRKAGSSRSSKRKAAATTTASDDESSEGFEDVPGQEEDRASTPEPLEDLDDTTEDSDADDEPASSPPPEPEPEPEPKKGIKKTLGGHAKELAPPTRQSASQSSRTARNASEPAEEEVEAPPPRRELPFQRRKAAQEAEKKMSQDAPVAKLAVQASGVGGDDGDTTDDEL